MPKKTHNNSPESGGIKQKAGGFREGSGRKKEYGEELKNLTFNVPISHHENVKKIVREYLFTLKIR